MSKGQTGRLTDQHISSGGAYGIFGEDAQLHDKFVVRASLSVFPLMLFVYGRKLKKFSDDFDLNR